MTAKRDIVLVVFDVLVDDVQAMMDAASRLATAAALASRPPVEPQQLSRDFDQRASGTWLAQPARHWTWPEACCRFSVTSPRGNDRASSDAPARVLAQIFTGNLCKLREFDDAAIGTVLNRYHSKNGLDAN